MIRFVLGVPSVEVIRALEGWRDSLEILELVVPLGGEGLTVNWIVSSSTRAIALAIPGIASGGIFGLGPGATGLLSFLFLGGTMFGLAAAAGAFKGPAGPASPSQ